MMKIYYFICMIITFPSFGQLIGGDHTAPEDVVETKLEEISPDKKFKNKSFMLLKKEEEELLIKINKKYQKCINSKEEFKNVIELMTYIEVTVNLTALDHTQESPKNHCDNKNKKNLCILTKRVKKQLKKIINHPYYPTHLSKNYGMTETEAINKQKEYLSLLEKVK